MREVHDDRLELLQGNSELEGAAKMDPLFALAPKCDQRRNGDERTLLELQARSIPDVAEEMLDRDRRQIFGQRNTASDA